MSLASGIISGETERRWLIFFDCRSILPTSRLPPHTKNADTYQPLEQAMPRHTQAEHSEPPNEISSKYGPASIPSASIAREKTERELSKNRHATHRAGSQHSQPTPNPASRTPYYPAPGARDEICQQLVHDVDLAARVLEPEEARRDGGGGVVLVCYEGDTDLKLWNGTGDYSEGTKTWCTRRRDDS